MNSRGTMKAAKKQPVILIVEDERSLSDAYQMILRKSGYEVYAAYDGQEA
ncbi:MAG TPA: hypothetical protein VLF43_02965 [Candidatus Saccharimonadales bacterium]|nr:hypothetical protein [Candidatus Saccharimonadales bacterium]